MLKYFSFSLSTASIFQFIHTNLFMIVGVMTAISMCVKSFSWQLNILYRESVCNIGT